MPINTWQDKEHVVCIYAMEYYSAIINVSPFATTWMDIESIV